MGAYCFGLVLAGAMALSVPERNGVVELGPGSGPIHRGQAGMRALTADGTVRTNIWIATRRFEAAIEAGLGAEMRHPLVFEPSIDWAAGAGASLRRLLTHVDEELGRPGGLADNPLAASALVDLFVHTALRGLPAQPRRDRWPRQATGPRLRICAGRRPISTRMPTGQRGWRTLRAMRDAACEPCNAPSCSFAGRRRMPPCARCGWRGRAPTLRRMRRGLPRRRDAMVSLIPPASIPPMHANSAASRRSRQYGDAVIRGRSGMGPRKAQGHRSGASVLRDGSVAICWSRPNQAAMG